MRHVRSINRIATALNGLAIAAAMLAAPGTAIALLVLSSILLVRNLEALRAHLTRENRP